MPALTTDQMVEVDRAMIQDFGIELVQMMESAGRNLAQLARARFLDGDPRGRHVFVLAGAGGNGGGAMVAARRLSGWGADVRVFLARPSSELGAAPAHQLRILRRMGVADSEPGLVAAAGQPALILDGILGYSLSGAPHGRASMLIEWANACAAPTLSLDVPSGLDATTGKTFGPAIRATATLTLALPKTGLGRPEAAAFVGELYLADIGVPPSLYSALGLEVGPLFWSDEIVRLS